MTTTTVERSIEAPIELVFNTVADIRNFKGAIPDIVRVEFLSEQQAGVGTKFSETRLMGGKKEVTVDLEVTELVENQHVRIVSDTHGTVWDTTFTVRQDDGGPTHLKMVMDANAYKFLPKLMNPLIKGMIAKAIGKDMDALKAYCERAASAS